MHSHTEEKIVVTPGGRPAGAAGTATGTVMTQDEFLTLVAADDGSQLAVVTRPASSTVETHTHTFDAKALVLRGELVIAVDGNERLYRPGDVFVLAAGCAHAERYGADGVTYLVART